MNGFVPMTQLTAGFNLIVRTLTSENPARVRAAAISSPFPAAVASVAPGLRGWWAIAMRPPGRITRRSSSRRSLFWSQNMIALTASTLSNGSQTQAGSQRSRAASRPGPCEWRRRCVSSPDAAFLRSGRDRTRALRRETADFVYAIASPKPISKTRSWRSASSSETPRWASKGTERWTLRSGPIAI